MFFKIIDMHVRSLFRAHYDLMKFEICGIRDLVAFNVKCHPQCLQKQETQKVHCQQERSKNKILLCICDFTTAIQMSLSFHLINYNNCETFS